MSNNESILQMTAVSMIRTLYPSLVLNLSLNGISLTGLSSKVRAQLIAQAKREGMETGVPDLLIYLPEGKVLNLEFKRPKGGIQSDNQKFIESQLRTLGHNYFIVRSIESVFNAIASYTSLKFRLKEFVSLDLQNYNGITTDSFLHWPAGTDIELIMFKIKQLYHI